MQRQHLPQPWVSWSEDEAIYSLSRLRRFIDGGSAGTCMESGVGPCSCSSDRAHDALSTCQHRISTPFFLYPRADAVELSARWQAVGPAVAAKALKVLQTVQTGTVEAPTLLHRTLESESEVLAPGWLPRLARRAAI